jgi:hypothetical protein
LLLNLFTWSFIVGPTAIDLIKSSYMAVVGIMDAGIVCSYEKRKGKAEITPKQALMYATGNVLVRDVARRIGSNILFGETRSGNAGNVLFIWSFGTVGGICLNRLMSRVTKKDYKGLDHLSLMNSGLSSILFLMISASLDNEEIRRNIGQYVEIY